MDRAQLADFLRTRRETLQPEDVGLPRGPRRRTGGLRREEVAVLCGMSTDYYGRLEQRRGPQPSTQMLAAMARGLRLTLAERDHLYRLAGHDVPAREALHDHVSPGLGRMPAVDPTFSITPPPLSRMSGTTERTMLKIDFTLMAKIRSKVASSTSRIGRLRCVIPALLTTMSGTPNTLVVRSTARATSSPEETSASMAIAPPPIASTTRQA